jgi:hypothetical protein
MCVVSNIGDYGRDMWPGLPPPKTIEPYMPMVWPGVVPTVVGQPYNGPTKEQFEEFLELLRAARKFDVATGQAGCPAESKTAWMREMAILVGVDPKKVDEILQAK